MITTITADETRRAEELVVPVAGDIRLMSAQAEAARRLPDELVACLKDAGLFSIYTPGEFGGLELPLPQALRVVEEVARHDGSTGWTVALGVANILFTSVLPEASAARVLGNGAALIAGAPAFGVRAIRVDGGYRLTGRWVTTAARPTPTGSWQRPLSSMVISRASGSVGKRWWSRLFLRRTWRSSTPGT